MAYLRHTFNSNNKKIKFSPDIKNGINAKQNMTDAMVFQLSKAKSYFKNRMKISSSLQNLQ